MAKLAVTTLFCVFWLTLGAGAVRQRADASSLPEGTGKALVATACIGCHDLNTAVGRRAAASEWRDIVGRMVERGAPISSADAAVIVMYLGQHYGASVAAAPAATLPDGPGKDVLMARCFQCHGQSMWNDLRQDRRAWQGVLYRMVGRRALWTEQDIDTMADYLARVRGANPTNR
jgi:cytochrome c5